MHKLHEMLEKIEETMAEQLNKGIDNVDTKEFGDVADIYKDLMCAKNTNVFVYVLRIQRDRK